jgi:regulator of sigma E protease
MKGQDDLKPSLVINEDDSYNTKKPWQKIIILFAGPFANFILAFVLYIFIGLLGNQTLSATIGKVLPNSPAFHAGLLVNDEVIKINKTKISSWNDLASIIKNSNSALKFYVKRDNKLKVLTIYPKLSITQNIFKEQIKKKMIGIAPAPKIVIIKYNFLDSLNFAYQKTYEASKIIFLGIQKMLQGIIPSSEVGGVITIGKVISDASATGIVALFTIMALVSVNLGVINLLPIPALDGGHIMFNLYEMITKQKPNQKVLTNLTIVGWVILLALMGLGLYNDITRLFLK